MTEGRLSMRGAAMDVGSSEPVTVMLALPLMPSQM